MKKKLLSSKCVNLKICANLQKGWTLIINLVHFLDFKSNLQMLNFNMKIMPFTVRALILHPPKIADVLLIMVNPIYKFTLAMLDCNLLSSIIIRFVWRHSEILAEIMDVGLCVWSKNAMDWDSQQQPHLKQHQHWPVVSKSVAKVRKQQHHRMAVFCRV